MPNVLKVLLSGGLETVNDGITLISPQLGNLFKQTPGLNNPINIDVKKVITEVQDYKGNHTLLSLMLNLVRNIQLSKPANIHAVDEFLKTLLLVAENSHKVSGLIPEYPQSMLPNHF